MLENILIAYYSFTEPTISGLNSWIASFINLFPSIVLGVVMFTVALKLTAQFTQRILVTGVIIATEVWQRGTFAYAHASRHVGRRQFNKPRLPFGINAARRSGWLLEMKNSWYDFDFILHSCMSDC